MVNPTQIVSCSICLRNQWLSTDLTERMRNMAGFRDIVVHGYEKLDLTIVQDIVENRLGDLQEFSSCIRSNLKYK